MEKYNFTMACIQYVVMIHLRKPVTLIELETEQKFCRPKFYANTPF